MNLNLRADNTAGWIPTHAKSIKVEVKELTTSKKIGEGSLDGISFPGRSKKLFQLPVNFSYRSLNLTGDPTYEAVHSACAHKYTNVNRPNLLLNIKLSMDIVGLVGTKTTGTNLNAPCPFELQNEWVQGTRPESRRDLLADFCCICPYLLANKRLAVEPPSQVAGSGLNLDLDLDLIRTWTQTQNRTIASLAIY